jgi:hypothetical protein
MLGLALALKIHQPENEHQPAASPSTTPQIPLVYATTKIRTYLEPVNLVHITRLMVPPVQKDPLRVQPLVRKQRQGDLDGPRTSIDKVPVEDDGVVFGWRGEDG